jgi:hypothetical protein
MDYPSVNSMKDKGVTRDKGTNVGIQMDGEDEGIMTREWISWDEGPARNRVPRQDSYEELHLPSSSPSLAFEYAPTIAAGALC